MAARAIGDDDADYSFLIKQCSSAINCCSVDVRFRATRWSQCRPLSGGRRVERSSNRVGASAPPRPPMLAIGIIGGMADCIPAGAAEMAGVPPTCIAVPAALDGGAAPVQTAPSARRPRWPDPYPQRVPECPSRRRRCLPSPGRRYST
jgi:hypothetical protein